MRFKSLFLIPLSLLSFLFVLLSFRTILNRNKQQEPLEKSKSASANGPQKHTGDNVTHKTKDSLIGQHVYYLEMRGLVRQTQVDPNTTIKGNLIDSVEILVFSDSTHLVANHFSSKHGDARFRPPLTRNLRLEIRKKGFVTKFIDVNTKVPPERKMAYIFPFDIDLFESIEGLDVSRLKQPIAKVRYDSQKANFEYDELFTNTVNRELKILYKSYRDKMNTALPQK
jgi:hypothetical protein